ncbi:hypothetical protein MRX96_002637 [Rhipicephalus microplus]
MRIEAGPRDSGSLRDKSRFGRARFSEGAAIRTASRGPLAAHRESQRACAGVAPQFERIALVHRGRRHHQPRLVCTGIVYAECSDEGFPERHLRERS